MTDSNFPMGSAALALVDAFSDHIADQMIFVYDRKNQNLNLMFVILMPDEDDENRNLIQKFTLPLETFRKTGEPEKALDDIFIQMHNELVEVQLKTIDKNENSNREFNTNGEFKPD